MVRQIVIELETPGDSRTMFRLRIDDNAIADDLTAAQAHVLIGEVFDRITMPTATAKSEAETEAPVDAPAATVHRWSSWQRWAQRRAE